MPLAAPISIKNAAEQIRGYLALWAEPRGGNVRVMASMAHLWEEIYLMTNNPRLLVCYNGEVSRGGFNRANTLHRVDRQWIVVIMRGHGFTPMTDDVQGYTENSFYDDLETIRERLRVIASISEEFPIDYKSMKPVPNAGPGRSANVFLDAYAIDFSTANDIPAIAPPET